MKVKKNLESKAKKTSARKNVIVKKNDNQQSHINIEESEIRAAAFQNAPGYNINQRIYRAMSQRLYLVRQEEITQNSDQIGRKYAVLGSTGNIYEVLIQKLPSCTCPDHAKGNLCKHIIFVLLKVLKVREDSNLIYQKALLKSELAEIFANSPANCGVQARKEVVLAFDKMTKKISEGSNDSTVDNEEQKSSKKLEGECPICFEDLTVDGSEGVDSCSICKNYLHKDCLNRWLVSSRTCCYCRSSWRSNSESNSSGSGELTEGYVNLGSLQGQSQRRDTSSYSSYHQRYYNDDFE